MNDKSGAIGPTGRRHNDELQNELSEIASELTALADMIPGLFLNYEDMEDATPNGVKILIMGIRNRVETLRKKK